MTAELIWEVALIAAALLAGGILKGATGAGAPILAVPVLALLFDVRFAIVVMLVPNLMTNALQAWRFRINLPPRGFVAPLIGAGLVGILLGTATLASLPSDMLTLFVVAAVFGYIALRLMRPDWSLSLAMATRLAMPAGLAAGFLQGSSGLSAPVSITFLNAMRLPRPTFIATISLFFTTFTAVQIAALSWAGLFAAREAVISTVAMAPILAGMPVGATLARQLKPQTFDRMTLALLAVIAVRLLLASWMSTTA